MSPRIFNPSKTIWTGNLSSTGFSARVEASIGDVFVISESRNFAFSADSAVFQERIISARDLTLTESNYKLFAVTISGLAPSKTYFIGVKGPGESATTTVAMVKTFPAEGKPHSFTFCAGAASRWPGEAGKTYNAITGESPLFMMHLGNLFSGPLGSTSVTSYISEYKAVLSDRLTADFLSNIPMYYIFDEHGTLNGYGPVFQQETNKLFERMRAILCRTADSLSSASLAYKTFYPLQPQPLGRPYVYQAFTVGRVRFIITDLRSQSTGLVPKVAERSTLGTEQRERLLREMDDFHKYKLMVWASSKAWHEPRDDASDQWAGYSEERELIANHIARTKMNNLVLLTGQSNMQALDDGSNTDFSTNGGAAGMPLMDVSPLAFWGSGNNASYSGPARAFLHYPNFLYGKLTVTDSETSTCLRMDGCSVGACDIAQSVCINATHPTIVRHGGVGQQAVLRTFPIFVSATMFAFLIVTIFISVIILSKVVSVAGWNWCRTRSKR